MVLKLITKWPNCATPRGRSKRGGEKEEKKEQAIIKWWWILKALNKKGTKAGWWDRTRRSINWNRLPLQLVSASQCTRYSSLIGSPTLPIFCTNCVVFVSNRNQVIYVPSPNQFICVPKPNQLLFLPKPYWLSFVSKPNQIWNDNVNNKSHNVG